MKIFVVLGVLLFSTTVSAGTKGYEAEFVGCHDGDTCRFSIQLGFGVVIEKNIRFCDVDAPEKYADNREPSKLATAWVERKLRSAERIVLQVPYSDRCRGNSCEDTSFERVLAWVIADGEVLNSTIISEGYAKVSPTMCRHK